MPARSAKPHFEKILLICTEEMDEIGDCLVHFFIHNEYRSQSVRYLVLNKVLR